MPFPSERFTRRQWWQRLSQLRGSRPVCVWIDLGKRPAEVKQEKIPCKVALFLSLFLLFFFCSEHKVGQGGERSARQFSWHALVPFFWDGNILNISVCKLNCFSVFFMAQHDVVAFDFYLATQLTRNYMSYVVAIWTTCSFFCYFLLLTWQVWAE